MPCFVTDIAPVHALVSQVMEGVGVLQLVIPPASSPHHYAMRSSEARMLAQADVVVWVGRALTPWLEGPIDSLAANAQVVELMDIEGTYLLPFQEGALFAAGGHDHDHEGEEEETASDPLVWLDPDNGILLLT